MSDTDDSTPAVWDPAARGGAGGWVRRPRAGQGQAAEPTAEVPRPAAGEGAGGAGSEAGSGSGSGADEAATALLPRVPEQQPEQSETALVRPYLPNPATVPDPTERVRPVQDLGGLPLFRPAPGDGASQQQTQDQQAQYQQTQHQQAHDQRTQPLYPGAAPPPPGYPPAGYARPPYPRPTPGAPAAPEPPVPPAAPQRRRTNPLLLVLAVVVAAALVGVVAVLALSSPAKHPSAQSSTPPAASTSGAPAPPVGASPSASTAPSGSATSTSPSASASANPSASSTAGRSQAAAVDQLLAESSSSRQQVIDAVAQVSQCNDPGSVAAAQTALNQAAASRQSLVTQLDALDVSQVSGGAQAVQVLSRAWSESATADSDYAHWAGAMTGNGCTPGNAPQNADYSNAANQSGLATTDKNTFIDLWTPIAMQYGLPTRTADAI